MVSVTSNNCDDEDEEEEDIYGPPPGNVPTSVVLGGAEDAPEDDHIDNYDMLDDVDDEYTLSEKMVHYLGGHVMPEHWTSCKAVLVFHAGASISKLATMTKESRDTATLEAYHLALSALDTSHFSPNALRFFRHMYRDKTKPINGLSVWRSYQGCRKEMRNVILPLFPTDFNTMKSGRGFHETINAVITKEYRKELTTRTKEPMTKDEADQELTPTYWEYKTKPWYFTLATKIYRRHMQVAPIVTDVAGDPASTPLSRAAQKRKAQYKLHPCANKKNGSSKSDLSSIIDVDTELEKRQKNKRKDTSVATALMTTNLTIRMAQMQELNLSLNFLDRMRMLIGDDEYTSRAKKLMSCLPDPETFKMEVVNSNVATTIESEPHNF